MDLKRNIEATSLTTDRSIDQIMVNLSEDISKENEQPLVSVVVPVYNSEKYICTTVKSIINQTYSNLEIILVNDGSTDNTPLLMGKLAQEDYRIKVINKPNEGTQYARKLGIDSAQGIFIKTLDDDDYLINNAIELLVKKALETDADMVVGDFFFCQQGRKELLSSKLRFTETSGMDYFRELCLRKAYWATWTTLHKRQLHVDNELILDHDIMMCEDTVLSSQLAVYSKKIVALNVPIIHFQVRVDSLSHTKKISDVRYNDLRKYPIWINQFIKKKNLEKTVQMELDFLNIRVMFESIAKGRFDNLKNDIEYAIRTLRKYPELRNYLSRHENKVLKISQTSSRIGRYFTKRYHKKNKM